MGRARLRRVAANANRSGSRRVLPIAATTLLASLLLAHAAAGAGAPAAHAAQQCPAGRVCEETRHAMISAPVPPHLGGVFAALPGVEPLVEHDEEMLEPQGPVRSPTALGPETELAGGLPFGAGGAVALSASLTPRGFVSTDLGEPPGQGEPQEPTAAVGEKVVWYTGNDSVALSLDGGKSFKYFNPATMFPEKGLNFCCDQIVSYSPQKKLFVWILQYWCGKGKSAPPTVECTESGTTSNRLRIAVASPAGLRANAKAPGKAWHYWNITPKGSFGGRLGGPGTWFDQSKMALNRRYVLWSVDVLRGKSTVSSVLMRISLAALAARKAFRFGFITESHEKVNVAQDVNASAGYFVGNEDISTERIWSWPNSASTATVHVIAHTSVPKYNGVVNGTTGGNWYSRWGIFPGSVDSAALSGSTIYVAQGTGRSYCVAACTSKSPVIGPPVFKEPAVFISQYSVSSWTVTGERWLYNNKSALTWPALQVDGAGDVGIVVRAAPEGQNPQPVVGFLAPGSSNPFLTAEPEGLPQLTGDYYSLRPGRTSESFVMTAQTVQSNNAMHWDYVEWGRGAGP